MQHLKTVFSTLLKALSAVQASNHDFCCLGLIFKLGVI